VFREYVPKSGLTTFQNVEEWRTLNLNVIRSVGGNHNSEDEIRQGYTAHGWPIDEPRFRKQAQIDRSISFLETNNVFVFEDLVYFLAEISNCMWELDNEMQRTNKIKDERKYHLFSCFRSIMSDFNNDTVKNVVSCRSRVIGVGDEERMHDELREKAVTCRTHTFN